MFKPLLPMKIGVSIVWQDTLPLVKIRSLSNTDAQLAAIRNETEFEDPKLNALRDFTRKVMKKYGRMTDSTLQRFFDAGYTRAQALDIVACIGAKVMSNYANQIALTPLDIAFEALADGLPYQEDRKMMSA